MIDINNLGVDIEKMMKEVKGMNNTHVTFPNAGVQIKKDDISTACEVLENDIKNIVRNFFCSKVRLTSGLPLCEY